MSDAHEGPVTETDVEWVIDLFRKRNEDIGFTARDHPVPYHIAVVDEQDQILQELPAAAEWPPNPVTVTRLMQRVSHDPHVPHQLLRLTISNPRDTRRAYVVAAPMRLVTPDGEPHPFPEPRYLVNRGQCIDNIRRETLLDTPALLALNLIATEAEPLHAAWIGGRRAPNPDEEKKDRMGCWYNHMPLPLGEPVDLAELIQDIWESIDHDPDLYVANGRTDFQLVILNGPPEPVDSMPTYPNIPIPPEVTQLQRSYVTQWAADDPAASLRTEIFLGQRLALADAASLIAGVLPELVPYAFDCRAELDDAVARHRRQ